MADDMVEDKLATMEQRVKYLEERVASQDQMIVEKEERDRRPLPTGGSTASPIGGAIKVELGRRKPGRASDSGTSDEA